MNTAILLVDRDLAFLFWLGRLLDHAGYQAFPARSVEDALALVGQLHLTVSLLILNHSLPGAETIVAGLREGHRHLKVILVTAGDDQPYPIPGVDAICHMPDEVNEESKTEWLQIVRRVLSPDQKASFPPRVQDIEILQKRRLRDVI